MEKQKLIYELGGRADENTQKSKLKLEQRTGHPTKLVVSVAVSEADKKAIVDKYNEHIRVMNELHDKQMEEMRQAHSQNVTKLYEFGNERYSEINDMLKHSDGFYVSGLWFWICAIFFWLGVIITIAAIAVWISRCG